jgi:hypothetical protein
MRVCLWLGIGSLAALLAACESGEDAGYAEIKINYVHPASDIFRLGSVTLDELQRSNSAIVRQPVGSAKLELARRDVVYPLCSFDVKKNRIVTVTISPGSGGTLQCKVQ